MKLVPSFKDRPRLWWYGLFLVDLGLGLWLISILDPFFLPVLNLLSTSDLTIMGQVGYLAFQFAIGFGAAVTLGWGSAIMAASLHYTKEVRGYLLGGMIAWYILDGISSFLSQFYFNIASNSLLLLSAIYILLTTETRE